MVTLLNPIALVGLALLGIPIIVHLFRPRRVRVMPFSSLRWLRASRHHMSRRIRWHQVLLFLLRAAMLALLVLALARPAVSPGDAAQPVERFVILDISKSMEYREPGKKQPIELARRVVQQLIKEAPAGDRTSVILAGDQPEVLGPLAADAEVYAPRVKSIRTRAAGADFDAALQAIRPMLAAVRSDAAIELCFITDDQRTNWSQAAIADFVRNENRPVQTKIINVGYDEPANAWIADARLITGGHGYGGVIKIEFGCEGSQPVQRTVRIEGVPSLKDLSNRVMIDPGRPAQVVFSLPQNFDPASSDQPEIARIVLDPTDSIAEDDVFWLDLRKSAGTTLLVVEPKALAEDLQPGVYVRAAAEALAESTGKNVGVERRFTDEVSESDITAADAIVLADVPDLADPIVRSLKNRVQSGAGLAIFAGPSVNSTFYNEFIFNADSGQGLIEGKLGEMLQPSAPAVGRLTDLDDESALLNGLTAASRQSLRTATFSKFYTVEIGGKAHTIAKINSKQPAIIEQNVGAGLVMFFNMSANDSWCSLPRVQGFVPLVDQLISRLAGGLKSGPFVAGQPVTIPAGIADAKQAVVTAPDGRTSDARIESLQGKTVLSLNDTQQPGVYKLAWHSGASEMRRPFVVQFDRSESMLQPIDSEILEAWWGGAGFTMIRPDPVTGSIAMKGGWLDIAPWAIALACLAFLGEMWLVHKRCPAVNPTVVRSSVVEHGLLAGTDLKKNPQS